MKRNQRGFTLLEVLVATTVMAFAVVSLLSALATSTRNGSRLTEQDRASLLARRTMDELLAQTLLPRFTPLEGRYDPSLAGGTDSGWRARIEPFETPPATGPGIPILERIDLEVWWMSGSARRSLRLEAFRKAMLRPEDMAALP